MKTSHFLLAVSALLAASDAVAMETMDTVEGTIHTECLNGGASCRAMIELGGTNYAISAPFSAFAGLNGATVKLHGTIDQFCPGGGTCHNFTPSSREIEIFGRLDVNGGALNSPIIPVVGDYTMTFGNGESIMVSSKQDLSGYDGENVWLRGKLHAGGGDLAPWFSATSAYRFQNWSGVGANVSRGDNTMGATSQTASSASGITGVGTTR